MIIYKCVISGDEMFSDTFKVKVSDNEIFYEVEGKSVTRKDNIDESLLGANPSAEGEADVADESSVSGVDIVLNHKLVETSFDKKSYLPYMKEYMKAVKAHLQETNPERVEKFMADAPAAVKMILGDIKNFQFFTGESMNTDGMVALLNYREDGVTPYMLFFKDGLLIEKC
ncbi:translationally-controlled tumor protein homolog isoform X2 [Chaetodon auriga]|uniref:translationally-controlled tumor protein homolog isoform X2 n=1 Tax=Chaetodon auriga TaxID=39042 RepID=UPI004032A22F